MIARPLLVSAVLALSFAACGPAPVVPAPPAPPARAAPALPPGPPIAARTIAADEDEPRGAVVVGDRVAWIVGDGGRVRVAPLAGGPAADLAIGEYAGALAADGDALIVAGFGLWRVSLDGTASRELAPAIGADVLLVDGDHVYLGATWGDLPDGVIARVPRAGGEPEVLVEGAGLVRGLAVIDGHVYWADQGIDAPPPNADVTCGRWNERGDGEPVELERVCDAPRAGSIWRVAVTGGAVELIAGGQHGPVGVAVRGDHVYWSASDGEALMRAPRAGGKPEVVVRGQGAALAADAAGVVVATARGLVVEAPASGKAARVRGVDVQDVAELALTADEVVVTDRARGRVVALRRGPARLTVLATPQGAFDGLVVAGDRLVYLDAHRDADRDDRVLSIGARGGLAEVVVRARGDDLRLGADAAHVVLADATAGTISVDGEAPIVRDSEALGAAVDGDTVYYVDGVRVMAVPVGGGTPRVVFEEEGSGWGTSGGPPRPQITAADGVVLAAGFPLPGLIRATSDGAELLARDVELFTRVDDGFVVWGAAGLTTVPGGRVLAPPDALTDVRALAFDGHDVWALVYAAPDGDALIRVPLDGGPLEHVIPGASWGELAIVDGALFLLLPDQDALLRLQL